MKKLLSSQNFFFTFFPGTAGSHFRATSDGACTLTLVINIMVAVTTGLLFTFSAPPTHSAYPHKILYNSSFFILFFLPVIMAGFIKTHKNKKYWKRNVYIQRSIKERVYIVMPIVGIVKGVKNYGYKKE